LAQAPLRMPIHGVIHGIMIGTGQNPEPLPRLIRVWQSADSRYLQGRSPFCERGGETKGREWLDDRSIPPAR